MAVKVNAKKMGIEVEFFKFLYIFKKKKKVFGAANGTKGETCLIRINRKVRDIMPNFKAKYSNQKDSVDQCKVAYISYSLVYSRM